jgi:serine/threonine protein kinase
MLALVARTPARIGRYELVTALATGGMGRIYLGRATGLGGFDRKVVIKTLEVPVTAESDQAIAMFLDEARLLGLLHHQHIASVFEVGRDDDGRHYMVLDFVDGYSAHDVGERALQYGAALPLDFTLTVVSAAASALHYAHTRKAADGQPLGIVHRDVSPSNVMIGHDGSVKLIDFGIAMAAQRTTKTQTGFVKGKVGYLSPEQVSGREVDARTDVFALGILLYELSTLHRAFRDSSDLATMQRIKAGKVVRPSQVMEGYPLELEAIVMKALQVDPAKRFADADAVRRAIEALGHRMRYVLGDAAVMEVMAQLYEPDAPPEASRPPSRASDPSFEWGESDHDLTVRRDPAELLAAMRRDTEPQPKRRSDPTRPPARKLRAATEAADALIVADASARMAADPAARLPEAGPDPASASSSLSLELDAQPPTVPLPVVRFNAPRDVADAAPADSLVGASFVKARRTRPLPVKWIAIGCGAAVLASIVVVILHNSSTPAPAPAPAVAPVAARTPALPTTKPPPPAPPPAPAKIRIQLTSRPSDATVLLDGKKLGKTPLDEAVPADPGKHQLRLRRGRVSARLDVTLDADIQQDVTLTRER